ncbi:MAG: SdpI family protein [Labedaea sp.]
MLALAAVPALAGLLLAVVGLLGLRERLPRNRFFGVRTAATLRDDKAFRLANKVAGLPILVGGLVGVLAAAAALILPGTGGVLVCVLVATAGMLAITFGAGLLGHRAALAIPEPVPAVPAGCGGCACGNCPVSGAVPG